MTTIADFFNGQKTREGFTIDDVLKYNYQKLESSHNYIQYLFPTRKKSGHHAAPVLTDKDIDLFIYPYYRSLYSIGFDKMLGFYGLIRTASGIFLAENFKERFGNMTRHPHNYLRITRILTSLKELGFDDLAYLLATRLCIIRQIYGVIPKETFRYWVHAVDPQLKF